MNNQIANATDYGTADVTKTINKLDELPYLLKYYKDNYKLEDLSQDLEHYYNEENNLNNEFKELLNKELNKYV